MKSGFDDNYSELAHSVTYRDLTTTRARILVTGSDAFSWLHALVSNDLRPLKLHPKASILAFCLDPTAHVLADLRICLLNDEDVMGFKGILVDTDVENLGTVMQYLDRYLITEDVQLNDVTLQTGCIALQGPCSQMYSLVGNWWDLDLTGFGGGILLFGSVQRKEDWLRENNRLVEVSEITWQTARVECGLPQWTEDFGPQTLAAEIDPRREHYSVSKGCYPGQEILARIDSRGHTNRQLHLVAAAPGSNLHQGMNVLAQGEQATLLGTLGSCSAKSPACGNASIALCVLRSNPIATGSRLVTSSGVDLEVIDIPRQRILFK